MSTIITNPVRYTVPSDSEDSDIEEETQPKFLQQYVIFFINNNNKKRHWQHILTLHTHALLL